MASAPDSVFHFKFTSPGGDAYFGYFIHDTSFAAKGQSFWSPEGVRVSAHQSFGHYQITDKKDLSYDYSDHNSGKGVEGTTWVHTYYDRETNSQLTPHKWANGQQPAGMLGQEYDHVHVITSVNSPIAVPPQPQWDDFGWGGGYLAGGNNQGAIPRQSPVQKGTPMAGAAANAELRAVPGSFGSG